MDNKRKLHSECFENKRPTTNVNKVCTSSSLPVEDVEFKYSRICADIAENNMDSLGRLTERDLWILNKHCYLHSFPSPVIISIEKGNDFVSCLLIDLCGNAGLKESLKDGDGDDIDDNGLHSTVQNQIFDKSLDLACGLNQLTTVKLLFQKDIIRKVDSALVIATQKGYIDSVKLILESHKIYYFDRNKAVLVAVEGGFLDILMLYYDYEAQELHQLSELLPMAAKYGHINIIKAIIAKEKPKLFNDNLSFCINNSLKIAAAGGHRDIIDLLLDEGANNILYSYAEAVVNGHKELSAYLYSFISLQRHVIDHIRDALLKVASSGNVTAIQLLLNLLLLQYNRPNYVNEQTKIQLINSCIISAAAGGHSEAVAFLLSQGANCLNDAFVSAAAKGHDSVIQQLLTAGATIHDKAFQCASKYGHLSTVQLLFTRLQEKTDTATLVSEFVVSLAIRAGHTEVVKYLIDNSNLCSNDSYNHLIKEAILHNHTEILQFLLSRKQPVVTDEELTDLVRGAVPRGNLTVVQILLEHGEFSLWNDVLHQALNCDKWDFIKPLIQAGATLFDDALMAVSNRIIPMYDSTTLKLTNDMIDIAKFLIDAGATNLNKALIYATNRLNLDLMKLLVEAGANAFDRALYILHSMRTYDTYPAINLIISKYLLSKGSNPFVTFDDTCAFILANDDGRSKVLRHFLASDLKTHYTAKIQASFIVTVKKNYFESVLLYLDHGLEVNKVYNQSIPLICAVEVSSRSGTAYPMTKLLLEKGANVNAQTKLGKTALIAAIKTKKPIALIELLVEKGAYLDLKDYDQKTALFWAAITKCNDQIEKVQYLLDRGADGTDLVSKKAQDKTIEDLISNSQVLELIKASNDAKPLYYCK